jgi:hypothetical protein
MNRLRNGPARPVLEVLEDRDVPSYLAAEFPGQGVWRYESTSGTWTELTTNNASQVAADTNGDVVAAFPGQGVWLCTPDNAWRQLTAATAASLDVAYCRWGDSNGIANGVIGVVADVPGQGLWRFSQAMYNAGQGWILADNIGGRWIQLTANDATSEAIDQKGNVAAAFSGAGVWRFQDSTGWQQLTAANASDVAMRAIVDGPSSLAAAFPGHGVWRFRDGTGWQQLTASDAATVGINGNGDVVGEFAGSGVWSYSDAGAGGYNPGWVHLTAADAVMVGIDAAGNVYGQFPNWGVWYDRFGSWQYVSPSNAASFGAGG